MTDNLTDFALYKKKKEYNKDNFYTPVFNAFMRNAELNIQEKTFFIYLQGFGEKCFQNQATICDELSISKPTLRKLMQGLEDKGYIYVQRKYSHKTKEKASPVVFTIPIDENTGKLSEHSKSLIEYLESTYPSDY
ncbi:helix-turn-helix domain-containing protein [Clostridium sp. UBA4548]|uniref:helix-turn-helix domain-containing protein n=1 Tax=Clostridium sp. UBA4548 TaxID=1946361 RepID=UPI0025C73208|nr:helix-turn-helix domain-containing protein [Clostridium sp. UBA4548]